MAEANQPNGGHAIPFGLVSWEGRYLTVEKFGNQINASATTLRSKQKWSLVRDEKSGPNRAYLKSPNGTLLETSKNGDVSCETKAKTKEGLLEICIQPDGRWAMRDIYGKYLAVNQDRLYFTMDQKLISEALWAYHIAVHPQVSMRSAGRKRYVHLQGNRLFANEDIPWGADATLILEFRQQRYALRDSGGKYLNGDTGNLDDSCSDSCLFVVSFHDDLFAFRTHKEKYLSVHGPQGQLVANKTTVGKDEQFSLEECKVQVTLAASNGRHLSVKQSIDVKANQKDAGDSETFQMDFHDSNQVTFVTNNGKYWQANGKSVTASNTTADAASKFRLSWHHLSNVTLKADNDKFLSSTSGGQITPTQASVDESCLFTLTIVNRPTVVLRCEHGYVASLAGSDKISCNRGAWDLLKVVNTGGKYRIVTSKGNAWRVSSDGSVVAVKDEGDQFILELVASNRLTIKDINGRYLKGDHTGSVTVSIGNAKQATQWEI